MSEQHRAFLALRGERYPRIGQRGKLSLALDEPEAPRNVIVAVTHLSPRGQMLRTRFVTNKTRDRFGDNEQEWYRCPYSAGSRVVIYWCGYCQESTQLHGEVMFLV